MNPSQLIKKLKDNAILKSSMGLLLVTLFVKIFGYVEKLVLAYFYGTNYQVDVYTIIFTIVISLFFFFREIVEPGFLNVFLQAKNNKDEKGAWSLFNLALRFIVILTIIISIGTILFPTQLVNIFAPGYNDIRRELCVKLIQIAIPACIFLALSTLTSITLNGLKIFALHASG